VRLVERLRRLVAMEFGLALPSLRFASAFVTRQVSDCTTARLRPALAAPSGAPLSQTPSLQTPSLQTPSLQTASMARQSYSNTH
jgi:hypothetical protein